MAYNTNLAERPPQELGSVHPSQWPSREFASRELEEESFISPRVLMRALLQWWYVVLPIAIVLAVVSGSIVMLTFTPVYRSTAVVKIASYTPYIAYTTNEQPSKPEEFTETQIELLRSALVMELVLADPQIAALKSIQQQENPIRWLTESVRVNQVGNSELYYVFLDAPDPNDSALLVNAILQEYFAVRRRDQESQTQRVLDLLTQEKDQRAGEIQRLREEMRQLGKNVIGADPVTGLPTQAQENVLLPLKELRDRLEKFARERRMSELRIIAIRESMAREDVDVASVEVEMALTDTQEVRDLRAQIAHKKELMHRTKVVSARGEEDPGVMRLKREIEAYERSLTNALQQARPVVTEQLKTMAALDHHDLLKQLEKELELQTDYEQLLKEQYTEKLAEAGESADQLLELEFTRAELAREEKVFDMIAERSMALQTESRAPGRVALLQNAEVPPGPVESLPLRNLAAVIFASGCLPFGLALLWELSVRRIHDAEQLSQYVLPVVGEVAKLPMRLRSLAPGGGRAMALFEESIDSVRVGLVLPDQYRDFRVIAITSAVHGEGKSSIASQLAVSIGHSTGEPVLLVDGDLRAPDVHHIFEVPNEPGLSAVLDGRASIDDAIVKSWSPNIHLLPAGRLKKSPHKVISIGVLTDLIEEMKTRYRYIVFDTPPILSASEALMLAKVADGCVLSTRRNVSRESQVRIAYERLLKAGAVPMGAVFNGVPTRSYAQTYGSYEYSRSFG